MHSFLITGQTSPADSNVQHALKLHDKEKAHLELRLIYLCCIHRKDSTLTLRFYEFCVVF